jgi:hypothetical protein
VASNALKRCARGGADGSCRSFSSPPSQRCSVLGSPSRAGCLCCATRPETHATPRVRRRLVALSAMAFSVGAASRAVDRRLRRAHRPDAARPGGNERQPGGDPAKLAKALVTIVDQEQPPLRWVAGADALETVEQKANDLLAQVDAYRSLSSSLAFDEAQAT